MQLAKLTVYERWTIAIKDKWFSSFFTVRDELAICKAFGCTSYYASKYGNSDLTLSKESLLFEWILDTRYMLPYTFQGETGGELSMLHYEKLFKRLFAAKKGFDSRLLHASCEPSRTFTTTFSVQTLKKKVTTWKRANLRTLYFFASFLREPWPDLVALGYQDFSSLLWVQGSK